MVSYSLSTFATKEDDTSQNQEREEIERAKNTSSETNFFSHTAHTQETLMNLLIHSLLSKNTFPIENRNQAKEKAKKILSGTDLSSHTAHTQEALMNLLVHFLLSPKQERAENTSSGTQLFQKTKKLSEKIARISGSIVSGFTTVRGIMKKCQRAFSRHK